MRQKAKQKKKTKNKTKETIWNSDPLFFFLNRSYSLRAQNHLVSCITWAPTCLVALSSWRETATLEWLKIKLWRHTTGLLRIWLQGFSVCEEMGNQTNTCKQLSGLYRRWLAQSRTPWSDQPFFHLRCRLWLGANCCLWSSSNEKQKWRETDVTRVVHRSTLCHKGWKGLFNGNEGFGNIINISAWWVHSYGPSSGKSLEFCCYVLCSQALTKQVR